LIPHSSLLYIVYSSLTR